MITEHKGNRKEAEYSGWLKKVERIDKIRYDIQVARKYNLYEDWLNALIGWRNEICDRMIEDENNKCNEFEDESKKEMRGKVIKTLYGGDKTIIGNCSKTLNEYERHLQIITAEAGLDMPTKPQDESSAI